MIFYNIISYYHRDHQEIVEQLGQVVSRDSMAKKERKEKKEADLEDSRENVAQKVHQDPKVQEAQVERLDKKENHSQQC